MLLYILAAILAFLWMLDAAFTIQFLRKKGEEKEANELVRGIYGRGIFAFLAFKAIDLAFVVGVLFLLSITHLVTAETVMFIFIYVYAKVDWHNYKIWKNRNSNARNAKPARSKRI
jgi:hypothetical protein